MVRGVVCVRGSLVRWFAVCVRDDKIILAMKQNNAYFSNTSRILHTTEIPR